MDIDGVLYPWEGKARAALQHRTGRTLKPSGTWNGLRAQVPGSDWWWLWNTPEGRHASFGDPTAGYPDAVDAVRWMMENGHDVHFVTHRDPATTLGYTYEFLRHHFEGYRWQGVHSIRNGTPKRRLARWDVFVDDKPETIWDFAKRSPRVKLFAPRRTWNTDLEGDRRVTLYEDAANIVAWVEANS